MRIRVGESISAIQAQAWNALVSDSNPFIRHEYLLALENSGCAVADNGWLPCPLLCESDTGELLGALPLYLKNHSHGEFVFDFSWANAYHQAGLDYYPKLVSAVPFTPATGPRLLLKPEVAEPEKVKDALLTGAIQLAKDNAASSLHILFPQQAEAELQQKHGMLLRKDCQFHWQNADYTDFDDFLATFSSAKRKKTRRERRRIAEHGIRFETRQGHELDRSDWELIMPLYNATFLRRGREPYLNQDFFEQVAQSMPENLVVFLGYEDLELVACAICFRSDDTLYGRYWGANRFIDSLHFETCYYQGIDYCIEHGLQSFEPGTQGEHKISRGFVPAETWSTHWLSQPQFAAAIEDYLQRERAHINEYIDSVWEHVPYRSKDK
jgi:predicted N-acyltransferase